MVIFLPSETIQKTVVIWVSYRLCIVYICQYKRQIRHLAGCDMQTKNVRRCSTKFQLILQIHAVYGMRLLFRRCIFIWFERSWLSLTC